MAPTRATGPRYPPNDDLLVLHLSRSHLSQVIGASQGTFPSTNGRGRPYNCFCVGWNLLREPKASINFRNVTSAWRRNYRSWSTRTCSPLRQQRSRNLPSPHNHPTSSWHKLRPTLLLALVGLSRCRDSRWKTRSKGSLPPHGWHFLVSGELALFWWCHASANISSAGKRTTSSEAQAMGNRAILCDRI